MTASAPARGVKARWIGGALALYAAWVGATWWLEGRIETLHRPQAAVDRLVYVGVANVLVGTLAALVLVRVFVRTEELPLGRLGFHIPRRTFAAVLFGIALGLSGYLLQRPPDVPTMVTVNAFIQVLAVTIAEVVVCWALLGGTVREWLRPHLGPFPSGLAALAVSAAAFGLYHFAHSPPFDTWAMVGRLTVVGAATGAVFFGMRSFYAAVVFHNFLGTVGVVTALSRSGRLAPYAEPLMPALLTGSVALAALLLADYFIVRSLPRRPTH